LGWHLIIIYFKNLEFMRPTGSRGYEYPGKQQNFGLSPDVQEKVSEYIEQ